MACGDVLSLEDLQTAKKHQIFEAEVITGKAGGVAGGADIDYATNQVTGQTQKTLPAVLRDVGFRPAPFTFVTGGVLAVGDSDMAVLWPISAGGDGQYYIWKGSYPKTVPANSTPATTGGVSASGWLPLGDITLRGDLASPDSGKGVSLVYGAAKQEDVDALREDMVVNAFDTSLESPFSQKVRLGQSDCYVLVQGDSTGDADNEWFRLTANNIAAKYPTHTVKYVAWVNASTSWAAPIIISTGTGLRTIWFYNGSNPGAVPGYWYGNRSHLAFDGKQFDAIFTNYGLNVPTGLSYQQEQHAEHLMALRGAQPYADIISCIQPVDYATPDRNQPRALAQKRICGLYGARVVDVMRKFLDLVESTGGDYTPWYADSLHPSPAGSAEWSKLTTSALITSKGDRLSAASNDAKNSDMPNGMFRSFLSGNSACSDFWVPINATAIKDQVNFETFDQSLRGIGAGDGSSAVVCLQSTNELMEKYKHLPEIVIAARVRSSISSGAGSGNCGRVFFAHSVGSSYTEVNNKQASYADVNDAFRWSFLIVDRSFWVGKSDFRIGVYCGKASEIVSIDRIIISPSPFVSDCSKQDYFYKVEKSDSAHSIPAGSTTSRAFTITSPIIANPGMIVDVAMYPTVAGVSLNAVCTQQGSIQVFYTNTTTSPVSIPANTVKLQISV